MIIVGIVAAGILSILIGRWLFGQWMNHITIYGTVWAGSLSVLQSGIIHYYPLESETWMFVIAAWILFVVGSLTVLWKRLAPAQKLENIPTRLESSEYVQSISRVLVVLNIIGLLVTVHTWYIMSTRFGGLLRVLVLGNIVRAEFTRNQIAGLIPYVPSLILTGNLFAGISSRLRGRIGVSAALSIVINIGNNLASMSRLGILMGFILFVGGYALTSTPNGKSQRRHPLKSKFRTVVTGLLILGIVVTGEEVVRSNRGVYERVVGGSSALNKLRGWSFITPSIVMYASVHTAVFNQYLKQDHEHGLPGQFTFSTVWRFLDKLGLETHVPYYQKFYLTPQPANTGTYLRELHVDFGDVGALLVPYLLGLVCSVYWFRWKERAALADLVILAHLMVVVGMSIVMWAVSLGGWLFSLIGALVCARILHHFHPTLATAGAHE